mmetsp:Transcript_128213/g.304439  ORF Transcript_128213/g.304439 Transcript_128213/m.304439 type:complete len:209 (-) Transcript_128213:220-846(-)
MVDLILRVLIHHTLHDLDRELHVLRICWVRVRLLFLLRYIIINRLSSLLVFFFLLLCSFNVCHVLVENFPLRDCAIIPGGGWRLCRPASFPQQGILGLGGALGEVELIAQGVLHWHFLIVLWRIEVFVDRFGLLFLILLSLLLLQDLHLILCFRAIFEQDQPISGEVHHDLIHLLIHLETLLFEGVLRSVVRRLRVQRVENAWRHLLL